MPVIARTDLESLVRRADRWVLVPRPAALPRSLRLENPAARAAFALATYSGAQFLESCRCCGCWTASWCEGCYRREAQATCKPIAYNPICSECDSSRLVCDQCSSSGISWDDGNQAAGAVHGQADEDTIQITGFFSEDGTFVPSEGDVHLRPEQDGPTDP